mgnify:CR=1 FL=1
MTDLIDQLVDLLIRIETEPAKARFLIGRVIDRAYQLQETVTQNDDHHRVIRYVVGRLASGNSVRKIARELGWGRDKLYAFCDRHGIDRPRRKKILV